MNTEEKNLALLPNGFVDLLPPDAEGEANAIGVLMGSFASFGYERVKPPLMEFEDSLFTPGPGAAMIDKTFRVMDPVSHRMMGLRSDITPQIARISSTRLTKEPRPLRLCYANDALRTKASQQRTERQFTQVGCELVGEMNVEADIETGAVALIGLDALGVKNVTIDLAYPRLIEQLFDQHKISDEQRKKMKAALAKRSLDEVKKSGGKFAAPFLELMRAAGPADAALKKLSAMNLKGAVKDDARRLQQVYEGARRAVDELGMNVKITIDPVESSHGFEYYSGFGFTLFARNVSGELGRGGRYDVHFSGKKPSESASGFTLYMDTVRKAMPAMTKKKVVRVAYDENWNEIRTRQRSGVVVIRGKGKGK